MHDYTISKEIIEKCKDEYELRNVCRHFRDQGDHKNYEKLLNILDKGIISQDIEHMNRTFYGRGNGKGVINVYRRISSYTGKEYFEKIYINCNIQHSRIKYVTDKIFPELESDEVVFPEKCFENIGKLFTEYYFKFI